MLLRFPVALGCALALLGVSAARGAEESATDGAKGAAAEALQYNRDVRPIFAEHCFRCHGPDSAARKGDLRLDRREAAVGKEAIKPGDAEHSGVVERIFSSDPEELMPPPAIHKELSDAQKDILKRWIAAGAEYEPHWAFIAPRRSEPPPVKNVAWVRSPIDRFILARLEAAGLEPAPEADRRTLARRLSLDMTGLPPAPEEVEQFVSDASADAYERFVDRTMSLPAWGEHRGRCWLDVARYGDTHGIHIDNYREMWLYRNWVIDAFNHNMPFDRFTVEQLAGDVLPDATVDQQIASGFNRCNITTSEGGAIDDEYLALYDRDRTETTAQAWLGLTAGCAVCHDHKFDPLSQREFYELAAFFNNTTQKAMDGNKRDTPPVLFVPSPADQARYKLLAPEIAEVDRQLHARRDSGRADFDQWSSTADSSQVTALAPSAGLRLLALLNEGHGNSVNMLVNGESRLVASVGPLAWDVGHVATQSFKSQPGLELQVAEAGDFERDQPFTASAWVKLTKADQTGALIARMDDAHDYRGWDVWIEKGQVGAHVIHAWEGKDAIKVLSKKRVKVNEWNHLTVTYDGSSKAEGLKVYLNGEVQKTNAVADKLTGTIRTEVPFRIAQRNNGSRLNDALIQDTEIYDRALSEGEVSQVVRTTRAAWLVSKARDNLSKDESKELYDWWLDEADPSGRELSGRTSTLKEEESAIKQRGASTHVMHERDGAPKAYVLFRGEYDKRRDEVSAAIPSWLPPMPADAPKNRLGLALWLVEPQHPLTARVTVNRFWQEVFGAGLVRTTGDLGLSGEAASHPELLDWLAVEFRESGWDVKKFFKLLVTSATYRQAANITPQKLELDAANRLLSRGPRFRMEAEMVRDYALAASGLLVPKIGGPSVRPYQPDGVWEAVAMNTSDTRNYKQDHGESLYRRSMYTLWKRSAPPASMDIFNAPSREVCTVRRERTNTPLQALVTLNDTQFVEAARHLAQRAMLDSPDTAARFDFVARRLLARPLRTEEASIVESGLRDLLTYYQAHGDEAGKLIAVGESKADASLDPPTLAAWTMITSELMNLDEVLNK